MSPWSVDIVLSKEHPVVAISERLFTLNGSALDAELHKLTSQPEIVFGGSFLPEALPSDVNSLLGYEVFMMTPTDWQDMSPGTRNTLQQWVRAGGHLLLVSDRDAIDLDELGFQVESQKNESTWLSGLGSLVHLGNQDLERLDTGVIAGVVSSLVGKPGIKETIEDFQSRWGALTLFGLKGFNPFFIILVLLGFALLVGPINLFVFAKSGQRHRLFLTTPIISLATSLLLILLIIFQDGFGGQGVRVQHIETGTAESPNAIIAQEQLVRTGVLFSSQFTLPENTIITPVLIPPSDRSRFTIQDRGADAALRVDPAEKGYTYSGDYYKSRSETAQWMESVRPSRERLTLLPDAEQPTVTSTFSYPLERIYYFTPDNKVWTAEAVPPGAKVTLEQSDFKEHRDKLDQNIGSQVLKRRVESALERSHSFVAYTSEAPGIDSLEAINWTRTETVITGILRSQP